MKSEACLASQILKDLKVNKKDTGKAWAATAWLISKAKAKARPEGQGQRQGLVGAKVRARQQTDTVLVVLLPMSKVKKDENRQGRAPIRQAIRKAKALKDKEQGQRARSEG